MSQTLAGDMILHFHMGLTSQYETDPFKPIYKIPLQYGTRIQRCLRMVIIYDHDDMALIQDSSIVNLLQIARITSLLNKQYIISEKLMDISAVWLLR